MKDLGFQRTNPQYIVQNGWIACQFKVKNNVSAILKSRQRSLTDMPRPASSHHYNPIHFKSVELPRSRKPSTAPHRSRRQDPPPSSHFIAPSEDQLPPQGRHFKTSLNNRKQLLYIRPYTRSNSSAMTIDQKKAEVYKEVNNPDLTTFNLSFRQAGPIEYLTEYTQPYRGERVRVRERERGKSHRASLNVLRQKLKRHYQLSAYQAKLHPG